VTWNTGRHVSPSPPIEWLDARTFALYGNIYAPFFWAVNEIIEPGLANFLLHSSIFLLLFTDESVEERANACAGPMLQVKA
jgi:hypothetical protein